MSSIQSNPLTEFHKRNDSIYLGSGFTNELHLVDVEGGGFGYQSGDWFIQEGLEVHIDAFNPMSIPFGSAIHFLGGVIPFYSNRTGSSGYVSCSVGKGCQQP
jgi:hypothetical protein